MAALVIASAQGYGLLPYCAFDNEVGLDRQVGKAAVRGSAFFEMKKSEYGWQSVA